MGIGHDRNKKCPCGSSIKFKNCCGKPSQTPDISFAHNIAKKLDELSTEFENDHTIIFDSENDKKKLIQEQFTKKIKNWYNSRECCFLSCSSISIKRSHTIQKSGPIADIAENGKVVKFQADLFNNIGKHKPVEIGIGEASVFPGFCDAHEKMFTDFENRKELSTEKDYVLQIFRTVCREVVIKEIEIQILKDFKESLSKKTIGWMEDKLKVYSSSIKDKPLNLKKIEMKGGPIQDHLNKTIDETNEDLTEFKKEFYDPFYKEVRNEQNTRSMDIIKLDGGFSLPINLAGRGKIEWNGPNQKNKSYIIVSNIIKNNATTEFILVGEDIPSQPLRIYANGLLLSGPLGLLSGIESWLIYGSDHWFITPSYWEAFITRKKDRILNDLVDFKFNVAQPLEYSIFDDVRKDLLQIAHTDLASVSHEKDRVRISKIIANESKKLDFVF